jgi:lipopolysaccharide transport protein LptA
MKPKLFFVLALAAAGGLHAEPARLAAPAGTNVETHITSKSVDFDLKSRQAIYRGTVQVTDPRVNLTCELLTARIPAEGGRVDSIIAESNVVILIPDKGATNRATADKAVYHYQITGGTTNETLELTGSPTIETPQGTLTGDTITWDRGADTVRATNQRMIVRPQDAPGTNHVPTNAAPEPKPATP